MLEMITKRKGDKHAAAEIFHQLELRNYDGGIIVVAEMNESGMTV